MPVELPALYGATVEVLFKPCSSVSGDAYDVFRIDESHIGFAVTDATGHGAPAALLTTLIRRTLRDVEITRWSDSLSCPARVLERANVELLTLGLEDCQFVAITYAILNEKTGVVRLSRGGAPFPIVLGANGTVNVIESDGPIVGAMSEVAFDVVEFVLQPGERLMLYTDGVEPLIGAGSSAESVQQGWDGLISTIQSPGPFDSESVSRHRAPHAPKALSCANAKTRSQGDATRQLALAPSSTCVVFDHLNRLAHTNKVNSDDVTVLVIERHKSS